MTLVLICLIGAVSACSHFSKQGDNKTPNREVASLCTGERVVCDGKSGPAEVCVSKGFIRLPILDSSSNRIPNLSVSEQITQTLASDKIATLDKKNTTDATKKYKLAFRIDGYTYDNKPRLEISVQGPQVNERLSGCLWAPWQKSIK